MQNKNYIVVGGSSGIGNGIVDILATQGANVWVLSRTDNNLGNYPTVTHIPCDVTTDDIPKDELPEEIHGMAYCPGSINLKPFRSLKPDAFQADFNVNVLGAVKCLQAAMKGFKKAGSGAVVMFSTVAVGQGMPFHASVAASKGAIEGLTKSLAAEWAPKIRVNCIAPSLVDTPLAERLLNSDQKKENSALRHPLKRVGTIADIAETAAFLLSDKSGWMTGQILGVDGGMSSVRV